MLSFKFVYFRMISEADFKLKRKTYFSERFKVDYSVTV